MGFFRVMRMSRPLFVAVIWRSLGGLSANEKEEKFATNDNKQLLDEVFVISKIIRVEARVITRSRRLRLITITETLIILEITKTESNNCLLYIE